MYILKFGLYMAILLGCIKIGIVIASKYKNRYQELKECKVALSILQTQIEYTMKPIPEIFMDIAQKVKAPISTLFQNAAKQMERCNAQKAWESSLEEVWTNLKKEDKNIMRDLGNSLGKTDVDGQIKGIMLVNRFLDTQIQEAIFEKNKNEKLYKTLGIVTGLTLVIMLL